MHIYHTYDYVCICDTGTTYIHELSLSLSLSLSIYICVYIYMSWVPGFTVPPPQRGGSPRTGSPSEWNMHAYAFICMSICICISTSTYACIAYACKHIRAWHVCTYICLHGMHAYMQASCHVHLHTTPTEWVGHLPRGGALLQYISCSGHLHCPPHIPQGGGASPSLHPHP